MDSTTERELNDAITRLIDEVRNAAGERPWSRSRSSAVKDILHVHGFLDYAAREYRAERDVLRLLAQANAQLTTDTFSPSSFVSDAASAVASMPRVEQGCVLVFGEQDTPVVVETIGVDTPDRRRFVEELSTGIVREMRRSGEPVYLEKAYDVFPDMKSVREKRLQTVLCCPIPGIDGDGPRGAIYIENRSRKDAFPEVWREAVEMLARQLALQLAYHQAAGADGHDATAHYRGRGRYREIVGRSDALAMLLRDMEHICAADACPPVLIVGETGVGKDLVARALHHHGPRRDGPFVAVNVTNLQPTTLEAELFGTRRGAFTDVVDRDGLFHEANGGILFLDEIGEIPLELQPKLLRVLEDHMVRRVGGRVSRKVDVWVIASTSVDLDQALAEGRLRRDLYYRLAGVVLAIPPLRERPADIEPLALHFAREAATAAGRTPPLAAPDFIAALQHRRWEGNVRELRTTIERLVKLHPCEILTAADLRDDRGCHVPVESGDRTTWKQANERFKVDYLRWAIEAWGPDPGDICRELDIHRTHLPRLCRQLGITVPRASGTAE